MYEWSSNDNRCYNVYIHWRKLVKNIGEQTKILRGKVVITGESMGVVGRPQPPKQTKESARSADKRPSPGYCAAICFYYEALGHMFLLVGCGRGARPYVSIMRR